MVYLWTEEKGWEPFEQSDTIEFAKRKIVMGDNVRIGNSVTLGDGVRLGNNSAIPNNITVPDGSNPVIINIVGSRYSIYYWGENCIAIGCQRRSINEWLTDYEDIIQRYKFTPAQIAEYRRYVEFIAEIHDAKAGKPA